MSWTVHLNSPVEAHHAVDAVTAAFQAQEGYAEQESRDAFAIARVALGELLHAVCEWSHDLVHVSMSGHANPGHTPEEGWANDMVTISVSRAST